MWCSSDSIDRKINIKFKIKSNISEDIRKNQSKYQVGFLLQKTTDPFAGAPRDENGTIL